jgi:hypothetical protein
LDLMWRALGSNLIILNHRAESTTIPDCDSSCRGKLRFWELTTRIGWFVSVSDFVDRMLKQKLKQTPSSIKTIHFKV